MLLMHIYSCYKVTVGSLCSILLIITTAVTTYLLKKYDTFDAKIYQIRCVLIVFGLSYTISTVLEIVKQVRWHHDEFYGAYLHSLMCIFLPLLNDILPIGSIYFLHYKNYSKGID